MIHAKLCQADRLSDFLNSSPVFHLCLHLLRNVRVFLLEHCHSVFCLSALRGCASLLPSAGKGLTTEIEGTPCFT